MTAAAAADGAPAAPRSCGDSGPRWPWPGGGAGSLTPGCHWQPEWLPSQMPRAPQCRCYYRDRQANSSRQPAWLLGSRRVPVSFWFQTRRPQRQRGFQVTVPAGASARTVPPYQWDQVLPDHTPSFRALAILLIRTARTSSTNAACAAPSLRRAKSRFDLAQRPSWPQPCPRTCMHSHHDGARIALRLLTLHGPA